jgi:hypothetical protein
MSMSAVQKKAPVSWQMGMLAGALDSSSLW